MTATFRLGGEIAVRRLGFGAMRLTGQPNNFGPFADWDHGKRVLRCAVELGVDLIDTARSYGPAWNERLIAEALHPYPANLVIATKGGVEKRGPRPTDTAPSGAPETLRAHILDSLARLRLDRIDLYYLHRPDPAVAFEAQVEALARARADGLIRLVGLSNVTPAQLESARAITPIAAVQNRYNLLEREDEAMLTATRDAGIAYVPWGPLGAAPTDPAAPLAAEAGAAAAIASLLAQSPNILAIPGTTDIAHLRENMAAAR